MLKPYEEIKKLFHLKQRGLIDDIEYQQLKERQLIRWGLRYSPEHSDARGAKKKMRPVLKAVIGLTVCVAFILVTLLLTDSPDASSALTPIQEPVTDTVRLDQKENVSQLVEKSKSPGRKMQQPKSPSPAPGASPEIKAYLIYDDHTVGSTDILLGTSNLWNVVSGEGSAEKPSRKTRIAVAVPKNGNYHDIVITAEAIPNISYIKEGLSSVNSDLNWTFDLEDTGCNPVEIRIWINNDLSKEAMIPFECGD